MGIDNAEVSLTATLRAGYLDLRKGCLTRILFMNDAPGQESQALAEQRQLRDYRWDWPGEAEMMIGLLRLSCIETYVKSAIRERVPGDLLEAGAWRGGATIYPGRSTHRQPCGAGASMGTTTSPLYKAPRGILTTSSPRMGS